MRVILHVGTHKTGTTSFQRWLEDDAAALRRAGVAALPHLPADRQEQHMLTPGMLKKRAREAERAGAQIFLVSHEMLSLRRPDGLSRLRKAFAPYETGVVIAFRHWTGYLPSRWTQNCRRRDSQSFGRFARRLREPPGQKVAAFHLILERFRDAGFEDVRVVSFDNAAAADDLVPTLARACGLPAPPPLGGANARRNTAWAPHEVERVRLFNGVVACAEGLNPDGLFDDDRSPAGFGRPFVLGRAMRRQEDVRPDLFAEIDAQIAARRTTMELPAADFADESARLERAVEGMVVNPVDGRLFPDARDRTVTFADLEHDDLPEGLRRRMLDCIRAPQPSLLRRAAGRARRRLKAESPPI